MKPLYLECNEPNGGLGNRATVICAGYATAKMLGREPKLYWTAIGHGCRAEYSDLFKPMDKIERVESIPEGEDTFFAWCYAPGSRVFHEKWLGDRVGSEEYWDLFREGARQLELVDELSLPEKGEFNALHVRGNYSPRAADPSVYGQFKPHGLFMAVDNKDVYDELMVGATDCWSLKPPTTKFDLTNRDKAGMQDAARDMMMLTRASCLLTLGVDSTFRNLATLGYRVPTFSFYKGESP